MTHELEDVVLEAVCGGMETEIAVEAGLDGGAAVPYATFLAPQAGGDDDAASAEARTPPVCHEATGIFSEAEFAATPSITEEYAERQSLVPPDDNAIASVVEVLLEEDDRTLDVREIPVLLVSEEAHYAAATASTEDEINNSESSTGSIEGGEDHGILIGIGSYVVKGGLTITEVAGSTVSFGAHVAETRESTLADCVVVPISIEENAGTVADVSVAGSEDEESLAMKGWLEENTDDNANVLRVPTVAGLEISETSVISGVLVVEPEMDKKSIRFEDDKAETGGEGLVVVLEENPEGKITFVPSEFSTSGFSKSQSSPTDASVLDQPRIREADAIGNSIDLVVDLRAQEQVCGEETEDVSRVGVSSASAASDHDDDKLQGLGGMGNRSEVELQLEEHQVVEEKGSLSGEVCVTEVPPFGGGAAAKAEKPPDMVVETTAAALAGGEENELSAGSTGVAETYKSEWKVGETVESAEDVLLERKRRRDDVEKEVCDDDEKTPKSVKTSTGEKLMADTSVADLDHPGEGLRDVKKRSREDSVPETANEFIQLKTQKTKDDDDIEAYSSRIVCEGDKLVEKEAKSKCENDALRQCVSMPRYKKRKIAIFLGYSGAGYQGMQKNPGAITIEGELEEALYRAGAISEANFGEPKKIDWKRAARTDKGVSAVGQVVSGSFFIDPPGLVERVNSHLPKQIRVYGYKRATAGFDAKRLCDRRKYEYVLPVYVFDPNVHLDRETARIRAQSAVAVEIRNNETSAMKPGTSGGETETIVIGRETSVAVDAQPETAAEGTTSSLEMVAESLKIGDNLSGRDSVDSGNGIKTTNAVVVELQSETRSEMIQGAKNSSDGLDKSVGEISKRDNSNNTNEAVEETTTAADPLHTGEASEDELKVNRTGLGEDISPEEMKSALDEKVRRSSYKYGEAEANQLNKILNAFQGNHNFHNFTARVKSSDPSANRYILSFEADKVFKIDGVDFVRCTVVGQSFMLHQIRKMIGLAVAIMRGLAPASVLDIALRRDTKIAVPMAPELGLFLEECYFSSYNWRFRETHEDLSLSSFEADVSAFKKEFIYPHIASTEARDSTFAIWLHSLNDRHFPEFAALREREKVAGSL